MNKIISLLIWIMPLVCVCQAQTYQKTELGAKATINGNELEVFWTGEKLSGGMKVNKETPLDIIPIYVKAGSILPIGPAVQYAEEKKWSELEIRIYPGANGQFELYEDENDNYNYEKGVYSTINFSWNDTKKILTIKERNGRFPNMLERRISNIVVVDKMNGTGGKLVSEPNRVVSYSGKKTQVKLM